MTGSCMDSTDRIMPNDGALVADAKTHRCRRRAWTAGQTNHIATNIIARKAPISVPTTRFPASTAPTTNASSAMESASGAIAAAISHDASSAKRDESRPRSAMRPTSRCPPPRPSIGVSAGCAARIARSIRRRAFWSHYRVRRARRDDRAGRRVGSGVARACRQRVGRTRRNAWLFGARTCR